MAEKTAPANPPSHDGVKIVVSKNGPYLVSGGVPLIQEEICNDDEGYCRTWKENVRYPLQQSYALCRCGHSKNKPFCDGTHTSVHFNGTEHAGSENPIFVTRGRSTARPWTWTISRSSASMPGFV